MEKQKPPEGCPPPGYIAIGGESLWPAVYLPVRCSGLADRDAVPHEQYGGGSIPYLLVREESAGGCHRGI